MGSVTKVHAVYDRPFWRDEGLNGQVVSDEGAVLVTFDDSPPDASHGILLGFIAGDECREPRPLHSDRAGRRRRGRPRPLLRAPAAARSRWWSSTGRPSPIPAAVPWPCSPRACSPDSEPALRDPVGPVHWAGHRDGHPVVWVHRRGPLVGCARRRRGSRRAGVAEAVADRDEICEAYADWRVRCNENERLRRMLRGWDKVVHLVATDTADRFTIVVRDQLLADLVDGADAVADLVVTATSEDFADLFWGDLNPSEKYMSGEITLAGAQEDVMRLDAMSMVAFLDQ
jgi:putative sterol carrier protein